jgi:Fe2+ or Zn2+ uptake regulation protein
MEDFITDTPDFVRTFDNKTMKLIDERISIIRALIEKPMSVKDIHELYRDESDKKYSKTIKTVYRYLDSLEKAGVVKVAGHRKIENSIIVEKLYCRTASIFHDKDSNRVKWYQQEEGIVLMKKIADISKIYFDLEKKSTPHQDLINILDVQNEAISSFLVEAEKNKELADLMKKMDISDIKSTFSMLGTLDLIFNNKDLLDRLQALEK